MIKTKDVINFCNIPTLLDNMELVMYLEPEKNFYCPFRFN